MWFQRWEINQHHFVLAFSPYISIVSLVLLRFTSDFYNRNAAVELGFVESKAQAHRLSERGRESVEVGQVARRPQLREGDGACSVVHSYSNTVPGHLVCEAGLPAVVPGSQLPVMLLCQTPGHLEI